MPGPGAVSRYLAPMQVRVATEDEIDRLASVWYAAWQDGHADLLPPELTRLRTEESFRPRLRAALSETRVVGPAGDPVGFCILKGDELYQLFVARAVRGTGVAGALVADGEARLRSRGVAVAWLACAIGNDRAARFYEKHGWQRAGIINSPLDTSEGRFDLDVWRYEKRL